MQVDTTFKELLKRYGTGETALKAKLKQLREIAQFELDKDERGRLQASPEQLKVLDELDAWVKGGGSTPEFCRELAGKIPMVIRRTEAVTPTSHPDQSPQSDFIQLVKEIASAVKDKEPERNPLASWEDLEKAADLGWLLPSSKVQELTGSKPKLKPGETSWREGCFVFSKIPKLENGKPVLKAGKPLYQTMKGGQLAWRVSKIIFHLPAGFDSSAE